MQRARSVLICEDHPTLGAFTTLALRAAGHEVELAEDAEQALSRLRSRSFRILVTDLDLPGQDGEWLLRRSRELRPATRRILTTGRRDVDVPALLASGLVHAFVPKPFGIPGLRRAFVAPPPLAELPCASRAI